MMVDQEGLLDLGDPDDLFDLDGLVDLEVLLDLVVLETLLVLRAQLGHILCSIDFITAITGA